MHDFLCSDPDEMLTESLAKRARYFKSDPEGVESMCQVMDEIRERGIEIGREEGLTQGREEGLTQGREEGLTQGRINTLAELVRDGLLAASAAAERLGMTPEQFAAQASEQGYQLA